MNFVVESPYTYACIDMVIIGIQTIGKIQCGVSL